MLSPNALLQNANAHSVALLTAALVLVPLAIHVTLLASRTLLTSKAPPNTRKVHRPPGTLPILENTLSLLTCAASLHDWITLLCQHFDGEPFVIKSLGRPDLTIVYSPQAFEDVFKTKFEYFPKGDFFITNVRDLLGDGIFAVDDAKWVHQRKTASHLFTLRALRDSMTATVQKHADVLHTVLQRSASASSDKTAAPTIDLFQLLNRFTIEAFAEIGFGIDMGCLDADAEHPFQTAFDSAQRVIALRFLRPNWFWRLQRFFCVGAERTLQQHLQTIDDTVLAIIAQSLARRQADSNTTPKRMDVVSLFLDHALSQSESQSQDSKAAPQAFDPTYLRDIVVNFLIAGRDTTAQALSWFFVELSAHPEVEQRIRAELATALPALGSSGAMQTPSMDDVQSLVYLEAALKETLRLHPSVPFSSKAVKHDVVLSDGTFLRRGTTVGLPFYAMGRLASVWGADAEAFKPERWIDAMTGRIKTESVFKFIAFNAGPRVCLGQNLAMLEMKLVVAGVLSKFHLALLPNQRVTYDFSLTLPVRGALLATVVHAPL